MTSLLFWRTRSSWSTPPRKCCHGNSKGFTIKLLTNSYIFSGKVTKFGWIIFLPLWVMGKKPQHSPPLGRVGLTNPCHKTRMLTSTLINSFMLTHRELKVRFLNRSGKKIFPVIYTFAYLAFFGFLFMTDLKKLLRYPKMEFAWTE